MILWNVNCARLSQRRVKDNLSFVSSPVVGSELFLVSQSSRCLNNETEQSYTILDQQRWNVFGSSDRIIYLLLILVLGIIRLLISFLVILHKSPEHNKHGRMIHESSLAQLMHLMSKLEWSCWSLYFSSRARQVTLKLNHFYSDWIFNILREIEFSAVFMNPEWNVFRENLISLFGCTWPSCYKLLSVSTAAITSCCHLIRAAGGGLAANINHPRNEFWRVKV